MTIIRDDGIRIGIATALNILVPGCKYIVDGEKYENIIWSEKNTTDLPSEEEINEVIDRLTEEYYSLRYRDVRREMYPSIQDQLDALWHDIDNQIIPGKDTSQWYLMVKNIKEAYPK